MAKVRLHDPRHALHCEGDQHGPYYPQRGEAAEGEPRLLRPQNTA